MVGIGDLVSIGGIAEGVVVQRVSGGAGFPPNFIVALQSGSTRTVGEQEISVIIRPDATGIPKRDIQRTLLVSPPGDAPNIQEVFFKRRQSRQEIERTKLQIQLLKQREALARQRLQEQQPRTRGITVQPTRAEQLVGASLIGRGRQPTPQERRASASLIGRGGLTPRQAREVAARATLATPEEIEVTRRLLIAGQISPGRITPAEQRIQASLVGRGLLGQADPLLREDARQAAIKSSIADAGSLDRLILTGSTLLSSQGEELIGAGIRQTVTGERRVDPVLERRLATEQDILDTGGENILQNFGRSALEFVQSPVFELETLFLLPGGVGRVAGLAAKGLSRTARGARAVRAISSTVTRPGVSRGIRVSSIAGIGTLEGVAVAERLSTGNVDAAIGRAVLAPLDIASLELGARAVRSTKVVGKRLVSIQKGERRVVFNRIRTRSPEETLFIAEANRVTPLREVITPKEIGALRKAGFRVRTQDIPLREGRIRAGGSRPRLEPTGTRGIPFRVREPREFFVLREETTGRIARFGSPVSTGTRLRVRPRFPRDRGERLIGLEGVRVEEANIISATGQTDETLISFAKLDILRPTSITTVRPAPRPPRGPIVGRRLRGTVSITPEIPTRTRPSAGRTVIRRSESLLLSIEEDTALTGISRLPIFIGPESESQQRRDTASGLSTRLRPRPSRDAFRIREGLPASPGDPFFRLIDITRTDTTTGIPPITIPPVTRTTTTPRPREAPPPRPPSEPIPPPIPPVFDLFVLPELRGTPRRRGEPGVRLQRAFKFLPSLSGLTLNIKENFSTKRLLSGLEVRGIPPPRRVRRTRRRSRGSN